MSTLQAPRTQEVPTAQQSLILVRNLFRTAMSSVCYLRSLFPEDCFKDRELTGINIKSLLPNNEHARLVCQWLEQGVFDALDKKYLRAVVFGIGRSPTDLLEAYTFSVCYDGEEVSLNVSRTGPGGKKEKEFRPRSQATKEDIKKQTVTMLRNIISFSQTLAPLPDMQFLTMKLLYYDDRTPSDYQPSYFKDSTGDPSLTFASKPVALKMGEIQTPYHAMALKVQVAPETFEDNEQPQAQGNVSNQRYNAEQDSQVDEPMEIDSSPAPVVTDEHDNTNTPEDADDAEDDNNTEPPEEVDYFDLVKKAVVESRDTSTAHLAKAFPALQRDTITEFQRRLVKEGLVVEKNGEFQCAKASPTQGPSHKSPSDAAETAAKKIWRRALKFAIAQENVTMSSMKANLDISGRLATELLQRMEKVGVLGPPVGLKGRMVIGSEKGKKILNEAATPLAPFSPPTAPPNRAQAPRGQLFGDDSPGATQLSQKLHETSLGRTPLQALSSRRIYAASPATVQRLESQPNVLMQPGQVTPARPTAFERLSESQDSLAATPGKRSRCSVIAEPIKHNERSNKKARKMIAMSPEP